MIKYLVPGTILIDRYEIRNYISKGGMGAVYSGFDNRLKCKVAIKQNLLENDTAKQLFQREAELLANLKHNGLPKVTDYFPFNNHYYLIMELIEGDDLQKTIQAGERLSYEKGLHFFEKLLDILIYLHSYNIIHADIKPSNLKIDNEEHNLKLLDFGIAKGRIGEVSKDLNTTGGTPLYMSLEQTGYIESNEIKLTTQSDLYSASATFYHLLSGTQPIPVLQRYLIREKEGIDPLRLITDVYPDFPKSMADVFNQGMELFPKNRYKSAIEMKAIIEKKKGSKYRKYTKWPSEKRTHILPDNFIIPPAEGIIPMEIINAFNESEIMLYYFDKTSFIYELAKLNPFSLLLKSILYQTSQGYIVCAFFYFPNPSNPNTVFASFENYINLYNPKVLSEYYELSRQSHWHLTLVQTEKREIVDVFEFENSYNLEDTLNKAVRITRSAPRGDFMKAKQEFMDTFTMEDLFLME